MECFHDDEDDEILSNFPFDDDNEIDDVENDNGPISINISQDSGEYHPTDGDLPAYNINVSAQYQESNPSYDSADEILEQLIKKENSESEENNKNNKASSVKKKPKKITVDTDVDDDDSDDNDEDSTAQIAALEAKLKKLKESKRKSKKQKTQLKTDDEAPLKTKTELCKHNKKINDCFFCQTKKSVGTNSDQEFKQIVSNVKKERSLEHFKPSTYVESSITSKEKFLQKKPRVAHTPIISTKSCEETQQEKKKEKKIKPEPQDLKNKVPNNKNLYNYAGISISHPKIGSTVLEERMKGRKLVKVSKIQSTMKNNDIEGDWVTLAVLVKKVVQKKTASGKTFSVWQLSDLGMGTENQTVGFFLFGEVYKQHWKLQVGTVIGLLNPTIMKQDKDSYQQLSISLDNPKKLMEIGIAKEFGVCKGIRKSDGRSCTMFTNTRYGEYCEFHLQKAFKKARAGRSELQSGGAGPGPDCRRQGSRMQFIKKSISSGEVHFQGKTLTLSDTKKNNVKLASGRKQQNGGLRNIMSSNTRALADQDIKDLKIKREKEKQLDGGSDEFKQLLAEPSVGTRNLMTMLHGDREKEEQVAAPKVDSHSAKRFLSQNRKELLSTNSLQTLQNKIKQPGKRKLTDVDFFSTRHKTDTLKEPDIKKSKSNSNIEKDTVRNISRQKIDINKSIFNKFPSAPKLGRGLNASGDIVFSDDDEDHLSYNKYTGEEQNAADCMLIKSHKDVNKESSSNLTTKRESIKESEASKRAKRKAVLLLQQKGSIQRDDPNEVVGKKNSLKAMEKIEERINASMQEDKSSEEKKKKRKGLLAGVLGNLDLNSEEGKKLLKKKSRNVGAIQLAEAEREEKYFDSLEKKERMEEKLTSIYEIKVTCYACKQCGYMAESTTALCKKENHITTKLKGVTKKFFACKSCKYRCYTYNKPVPVHPCKKCGDCSYDKVSMATERKGPKLGSETLELRGREEKFLNSMY